MTLAQQICDTFDANPEWTAAQIGKAVGSTKDYVRAALSRSGRRLFHRSSKLTEGQKAEIRATPKGTHGLKRKVNVSYTTIHRIRSAEADPSVPYSVLAERGRRIAALLARDLTATLMGDPPCPKFRSATSTSPAPAWVSWPSHRPATS